MERLERSGAGKISKQSRVFHHMVLNLVADTVISLITGIIYGYSLCLILEGQISPGTLLAFIVILPRLYGIFKSLFTLNIDMSRHEVIVDNLNEILELEKTESGAKVPDYTRIPQLQLRNVSYRYAKDDSFDFGVSIWILSQELSWVLLDQWVRQIYHF